MADPAETKETSDLISEFKHKERRDIKISFIWFWVSWVEKSRNGNTIFRGISSIGCYQKLFSADRFSVDYFKNNPPH